MKTLRKRAKTLQVDTTKWQPPYDVESYTKQVELAERLIEEMKGLISKAKTLHVDLKTTTINDVTGVAAALSRVWSNGWMLS